jgi:type II secretory pathway pseudopilin PulG
MKVNTHQIKNPVQFSAGFTLVEVLVSIAIL